MNQTQILKQTAVTALLLATISGCATAPQEESSVADVAPVATQPAGASASDASKAIAAARSAAMTAMAEDALWNDTDDLLQKAYEAQESGDYTTAQQLASQAEAQANNSLQQKRREVAAAAAAKPAADSYRVVRGDSLWSISGQEAIYANPFQWPLIYKANRDQISDADLIYPGQQFTIERGVAQGDIEAAVTHAKQRGSWMLGVTEMSDRRYLAD